MPAELRMLLPLAVAGLSACLLFVAARLVKQGSWCGPFAVLAISLCAVCLAGLPGAESFPTREVTLDPLSQTTQWVALGIGLLWTLASLRQQRANRHAAHVFGLMLSAVAGTMLAGAANDLMVLFAAMELVCLPMAMMIWISAASSAAREAATKLLLISALSSALLLLGLAFVYGIAGSTNLDQIAATLSSGDTPAEPLAAAEIVPRLGIVALILTFAGLGFRLAVVPFHFGLRDAYAGANDATVALLATLPRFAAVVVVVRLLIIAMARLADAGMLASMVVAGVTMIACSMAALTQTRVRQILTYTTMAHGGFTMLALSAGFWGAAHAAERLAGPSSMPGAVAAAMFYLGVFSLSTLGLFAGLIYLARSDRGIEYVDDLSGLMRSEPLCGICMSVLLLSLIGTPPLAGFWGRTFVIGAALSVGGESPNSLDVGPNFAFLLLTGAAACYVLMTAAVYIRMLFAICFERQRARPRPGGGKGALISVVLAAALTIAGGLWPTPALEYLSRLQKSLEPSKREANTQSSAMSVIEPATQANPMRRRVSIVAKDGRENSNRQPQ